MHITFEIFGIQRIYFYFSIVLLYMHATKDVYLLAPSRIIFYT